MRKCSIALLISVMMLSISCLAVPPHQGGFGLGSYTYVEEGELNQAKPGGLKRGEACVIGDSIIPGLFYSWRGDSSIRAAARNGNVKEIRSVARSFKRPFFGSILICTVVYGD